jgi:hypothetical protein
MMDSKTASKNFHESEAGQAAAVVALLLFFVFLPLAALAIDGSMVYLVRRDLQNVADATALSACRVLAEGGDTTAATSAAQNTLQTNLGANWSQFVSPQVGTGAGLLRGLEIGAPDVRVALQRPAPTVLTQFVGRGQTMVTAQAHCLSNGGGGLLPIAVQRYDGAPGGTLRDYLGNKSASGVSTGTGSCARPVTLVDPPLPYPSDSVTQTWAGRYGPFPVPVPQYPASDGSVSDSNTGPEVLLLGQSADTNNNESSMRDLVLLDIRNVASGIALEYYNGANSQADAAKNMSQDWIYQHGYPGPYPQTGSQVAILSGASNAFAAGAMQTAGYHVGDAVAAVVYDGYVWTTPNYKIVITPPANNGIAGSQPLDEASAVAYTVAIVNTSPANTHWYTPIDLTFNFDFTNKPVPPGTNMTMDGNPVTGGVYTVNGVTEAGWSGTLRIWSSQLITPSLYLSGLNLFATSSLRVRGASTNYGFGVPDDDFALRNGAGDGGSYPGKLVVRLNQGTQAVVTTFGAGSFAGGSCKSKASNVPVYAQLLLGGAPQAWGSYFSSSQNTNVDIAPGAIKTVNFTLTPNPSAFLGSYTLRISVDSWNCTNGAVSTSLPPHTMDIPLDILEAAPNATPDKFVYIQGYAVFRISCVDPNDVWGYAISPLYESFEDITVGLRPRLVPWN